MRRVIAAAAAAGVLVAGAFVASSVMSDPADAQTLVTETTDSTDGLGPREAALDEVLAELVASGTIDQGQSDAVKEALQEKAAELREARQERRAERREQREIVREFLEDDVITSDELAQLGDDHPFNDPGGVFADAAADGKITREELQELHREHRPRWRGGADDGGDNA